MKLKEAILLPNCPEWLKAKDIQVHNEDITIMPNGRVIWVNGTWINGTWENGVWENGTWEGGTWEYGIWKDGVWRDGTWKNGTWKYGIWKDGIWKYGVWEGGVWEYGIWKDGIWRDGIWRDGTWKNGTWERGIWVNGFIQSGGFCKWNVCYSRDYIRIGCKTKTIEEWEEFFNSNDTYETERNTEEFTNIYKSYKLARLASELFFNK